MIVNLKVIRTATKAYVWLLSLTLADRSRPFDPCEFCTRFPGCKTVVGAGGRGGGGGGGGTVGVGCGSSCGSDVSKNIKVGP